MKGSLLLLLAAATVCSALSHSNRLQHDMVGEHRTERQLDEPSSQQNCGRYSNATSTVPRTNNSTEQLRIYAQAACDTLGVVWETLMSSNDTAAIWLDTGDYLAFDVYIPSSGVYVASYRVSSPMGRGAFHLVADDADNSDSILQRVSDLPATGDWQVWVTTTPSANFYISSGWHTLNMEIKSPGFNLHWWELGKQPDDDIDDNIFVKDPILGEAQQANSGTGFVRAAGTTIVDGTGENLLLRGMGFGGWMLQEPYMMLATDGANAQHDMFANVVNIIGNERFEQYRTAWLDNYCTQDDVRSLKEGGFNSLRAPLHYNLFTLSIQEEPVPGQDTWLDEGFDRLDELLSWCRQEQTYLILDLHAAPGGQGRDAAISDYDDTKPSLWEDPENVRKTVALWRELATRYRDEEWIAGYDLLNEPNWNFEPGHPNGCTDTSNAPLKAFYDEAVRVIREVDPNHLIMIEGNCWCNNHNGLWPIADDNIALSFHRYWIDNTVSSIQKFLDWGEEFQVPLWMGESGENNNVWYGEAVRLLETHNIGWAWWTWKKMESESGSFSIAKPEGYQTLLDYWAGSNPARPDPARAFGTMMELAENIRLENTFRNENVFLALTGPSRSCEADTGTVVSIASPSRMEAEDYCEMNGMSSETSLDTGGGFNIGWIDPGDWVSFRLHVPASGDYLVEYRVASIEGSGAFELLDVLSGATLGTVSRLPSTGGWQNWETVSHMVSLDKNSYVVRIQATEGGWNLNWMQWSLKQSTQYDAEEPTSQQDSGATSVPPIPTANSTMEGDSGSADVLDRDKPEPSNAVSSSTVPERKKRNLAVILSTTLLLLLVVSLSIVAVRRGYSRNPNEESSKDDGDESEQERSTNTAMLPLQQSAEDQDDYVEVEYR